MARRRLAPWEEIGYFKDPVWSVVTPNAGGAAWQPLVTANPNRVALILSAATSAFVTTDPTISNANGIILGTSQETQTFLEKDVGPLTTAAWFISANSGGAVTVVEIILREMPGEGT